VLKGAVAATMQKQVAEAKVRTRVMAFDVTNDLKVEEVGSERNAERLSLKAEL